MHINDCSVLYSTAILYFVIYFIWPYGERNHFRFEKKSQSTAKTSSIGILVPFCMVIRRSKSSTFLTVPVHEAACVAGGGSLRQLRRYGVGFFDFLGAVLVTVILIAAFAVPILDIALGGLGRRHCREVFQIRVVVCIQLSVAFATELTLCLILAGGFPAGVLSQLLAAIITLVVFVIVCTLADYIIADITFVVFILINAIIRFDAFPIAER